MKANGKKLIAIVLVAVLCVASYMLGRWQGAAAEGADSLVGGRPIAAGSGEAENADSETPSSGPAAEDWAREVGSVVATEIARQGIESEQRQRLMRNISENLAMPGMNRIIQEQQRVLMADQYRSLIEMLGLNDTERGYFLDLLTTRQMYHVDMGMKLMTGMLSESERNELLQRVGAGIDAANREIDWFLNSKADSDYFRYYDRTEGERSVVDAVSDQLSQAGDPLEGGMDRELVAIMYEQLRAYPFSVNLDENGEPVFENFTGENIDTFIRELQNLRDPVMQQASEVLTPEQLEVFAGSFSQYVAFYDQRLRMVQQLFNPTQ